MTSAIARGLVSRGDPELIGWLLSPAPGLGVGGEGPQVSLVLRRQCPAHSHPIPCIMYTPSGLQPRAQLPEAARGWRDGPSWVSVCSLGTSRISELLLFSARPVLAPPVGILSCPGPPTVHPPGLWSLATWLGGGETGACVRNLREERLYCKHAAQLSVNTGPASLCRQEPGWGRGSE